ncbi:MAG: hypothetical protein EOO36_08695 [Cytophagaceae bacterium]|nr:MAG: hypothetical protein EOO36_08695 [Cytophagaceae bacterium]
MNTKILCLASAAAFTFASCSDNKTADTTTTTTDTMATPPAAVDSLAYRSPADQLAAQVANDIKLADTATVRKIKQVYYNRGRALGKIDAMTDTTGRYAAIKAANDRATAAVKGVLPAGEYTTYAANQGTYYSGPYTVVTTTTTTAARPTLAERVGQGSGIKKLENDDDDRKVKFENGAKIKRSDDGSVKIKRADGTKVKIDEDGHRTVKKGLF